MENKETEMAPMPNENKQMEMAPIPNLNLKTESSALFEGGKNLPTTYKTIPNDVCCLIRPGFGIINANKEF